MSLRAIEHGFPAAFHFDYDVAHFIGHALSCGAVSYTLVVLKASGIAEVVKYGLIKDGDFFTWQEGCMERMAARDPAVLAEAVERSCVNKAKVCKYDGRKGRGGRDLPSQRSSGRMEKSINYHP